MHTIFISTLISFKGEKLPRINRRAAKLHKEPNIKKAD
jgi:hypothetical protein